MKKSPPATRSAAPRFLPDGAVGQTLALEESKAKWIRDLLDRALDLKVPDLTPEVFQREFNIIVTRAEISKLTFAEVIVRQLVRKAATGNDRSIQEVLDRLLGKAMQTTESVQKTYNYHDFLIQCREADAAEKSGRTIDITPTPFPRAALPAPAGPPKVKRTAVPPVDVLADLLGDAEDIFA